MKIVIGILIVGTLALIGYFWYEEYSFARYKVPGEAEVVAIESKRSRKKGVNPSKSITYNISIKYTPINGNPLKTSFKMEQDDDIQVGSTIPIYYHSRKHQYVKYRRSQILAH
ncbi:MAG: hypothetical protein HC892_04010 [Saprospiraceae bacterium]|nr:hypothetical protein [Saprospiraceae bacterium]